MTCLFFGTLLAFCLLDKKQQLKHFRRALYCSIIRLGLILRNDQTPTLVVHEVKTIFGADGKLNKVVRIALNFESLLHE